jgi:hypothetical protein
LGTSFCARVENKTERHWNFCRLFTGKFKTVDDCLRVKEVEQMDLKNEF